MKILLTGGGSGGHFYPTIAVAEELNKISREEKIIKPELFYMGPEKYDEKALFENGITYYAVSAGKMRRYFSLKNISDIFVTGIGVFSALFKVFSIFPDVVFAKGGYASFPVLFASRILRIPVIIHESDTVPGKVNMWAGKFAKRVAISFGDTAEFFDKEKIAFTGNPIRKDMTSVVKEGAAEFLKLDTNTPVILILGGSQGAHIINDLVLEAIPELVKDYQIIHQTGVKNFETVKQTAGVMLGSNENQSRYRPFPFLNTLALRMSAGASDVVVSRAGSGAIFEISAWEKPSIMIPITESNGDHQRKNAYAYARSGAATVVEEKNLTSSIIVSELRRMIGDQETRAQMSTAAKQFSKPEAANTIAREIIRIALEHEK